MVDGVAKLLVKSDIEKLKSKDLASKVDASESEMATAWSIVEKLWESDISRESSYPVVGRFHCRVVLWVTSNGKLGFEKKEYKTLEQHRVLLAIAL